MEINQTTILAFLVVYQTLKSMAIDALVVLGIVAGFKFGLKYLGVLK